MRSDTSTIPLGVGYYTTPEAARLLRTSQRNIRRWLGGYRYRRDDLVRRMPPLWQPLLSTSDGHIELSFRDLIELRFVKGFMDAGLGLKAIRGCLDYARRYVNSSHPFSTNRFRTDGKTIFLESLKASGQTQVLDLRGRQYAFHEVVQATFKDLDVEDDAVARWRPHRGKASIVMDPARSFGQPIASDYGTPTVALAEAVAAEGSVEKVARAFGIPSTIVRDAVDFERALPAA